MAFGRLKVDELETSTQTVNVDALVGIAADGDKGDITVSGSGTVWSIDDGAVDTAALGGDITVAGKALLDDVDAAAQRTTLGAEAAGTAASAISTHEAAADPHPGYALESSLATVATTGAYADLTGKPALVANLDDLGDVDLTTTPPADGEALVYDSATGDWVPGAAGGGIPGGTTGQIQWNSSGSFDGVSGSTVGATGDITLSLAGAADTPPLKLTGTWFSGGTSTTTKPQFLIEPTGTTSTAWSTSGTGLGVNAPSGFTGNLLDLQVNGTSLARFSSTGALSVPLGNPAQGAIRFGNSNEGFYGLSQFGFAFSIDTSTPVFAARYVSPGLNLTSQIWGLGLVQNAFIGWGSQVNATSGHDLLVGRDAANTLAQRNGTNAQTYRLYNTFTNASNYQRTSITDDSTGLVIDQQYAGTGAARTNLLDLKNNGTSQVKVTNNAFIYCRGLLAGVQGTTNFDVAIGVGYGVALRNTQQMGWSSGVATLPADVGFKRDQAGVVAVTDGSTGTGYLKQTPVAVSALPAAATVGAGTRGFVSDSTVAASGNFGATVTGGGSNNVPVFSDGTNWLIG